MDSATSANAAWRAVFRLFGVADESRFPDFAEFVAANNADYQLGATPAEVRDTFFELLSQADQNPIPLPDLGISLDGPWFRTLTFAGLYSDSYFADTARIWQMIKEHQGSSALQPLVSKLKPAPSAGYPDVP